jgi:hypothetical protein
LHELTEIVRQAEDPEFANILNRVREGKQTPSDCQALENLNNTDVSNWPYEPIKIFSTNRPADESNIESLKQFTTKKYSIMAKDKPNALDESISRNKTGNLPHTLKVCVGARVMLTVNLNTQDHLVNGSMGTISDIQMSARHPLRGIIYVKFDKPQAGNSRKNKKIHPDWVPIIPHVQSFRYKDKHYHRKQFPIVLAHAKTCHKCQGCTCPYLIAHLNTGRGTTCRNPGWMYTLLSRGTNRSGIKLNGFKSDMITLNKHAVAEMKRMREERVFRFDHPISYITSRVLLLLNLRSWIKHIAHHFNDQFYLNRCSIMCFTETNVNGRMSEVERIESFHTQWRDIHKDTEHGLAICYNKENIVYVQELEIVHDLEATACIFKYSDSDERFIIFLIYRKNGTNIQNFFQQLSQQLTEFASFKLRIILLGDFNLDPWQNNNNNLHYFPLQQRYNLHLKSDFATHICAGVLDLIFDTDSQTHALEWLPTPFSDHFMLFYGM